MVIRIDLSLMSAKGVGKNRSSMKLHHNPHKIFLHQDWREALYPDGSHTRTADWLSVEKLQRCRLADDEKYYNGNAMAGCIHLAKEQVRGCVYCLNRNTNPILPVKRWFNELVLWFCDNLKSWLENTDWWFLSLLLTWLLTIRMEVLLPTSLSYWSVGALLNL